MANRIIITDEDLTDDNIVMVKDVAAHERLTKADGSLNVTEVAKNLGIRPKDLFD